MHLDPPFIGSTPAAQQSQAEEGITTSTGRILVVGGLLWLIPVGLTTALIGIVGALDLGLAWLVSLRIWIGWLFCLPGAIWLAFRHPLIRSRLFANVAVHLLGWLLVIIANQALARYQMTQVWGDQYEDVVTEASQLRQKVLEASLPPTLGQHQPRYGPTPPRARFALDSLLYAIILAACQSVRWARIAEEREKRALAIESRLVRTQISSLQQQLNPHFMFNALNGLNALIHEAPHAAEKVLEHLSELLRSTLSLSHRQEVSLDQELNLLEHYLALEKTRHGDRLSFELQVDPAARVGMVPTFLLQPLVENAIRHGIEPQRQGGKVCIKVKRENERMILEVRDNGKGLKSTPSPNEGVGLGNTRRRIEQLYPSDYELALEDQPGGGCQVKVIIPFRPDISVNGDEVGP